MTRLDLLSQLAYLHDELGRVALAVEEALQPTRAELLVARIMRLEERLDTLIDALPTLEDTP